MSKELRGIGIDLGTTYSSVGYFRNGKFQIIPNEEGDNRTPSYVAFTDRERLIGSAAKRQVTLNPNNTIFNVQRLLGRKFDDATVQADMKYMPFKVIDDRGKLKIEVNYKNETKLFTPEEILSMIFSKMKEIAEKYLGVKVSLAVIAVPAKFNFSQRLAIKDAALIAGLNVNRTINGSMLASIVYGIGKKTSEERKVLAFDMGGGNLNISILIIEEGVFEVKSVAGDTHLGGEDFDNRLVTHFVQEFQGRTGKTLQNNKRALQRLRTACEYAKRTLSSSSQASIEIDSLFDGIDFYSTITRAYFEELCDDLFRSTLEPVKRVLRDAKIDKTEIDEIVIVGGSTRIPKVQELLQDFFNRKELNKSIDSDEAVAFGAAIMTGDNREVAKDVLLLNITPFSLGVEGARGVMTVVIKRNTTIPTKQTCTLTEETCTLTKYSDDLLDAVVKVFEGEYLMTVDNHLLGEFKLSGISRAENNTFKVEVTFDIDNYDTLIVSITDKISGKKNQMNITDKNRLTEDEIQRMIFEAEQFRKDDKIRRECDAIKQSLELYCLNTKETLMNEKLTHEIDTNERKIILDNIDKIFVWMETNKYAEKFEYEYKFKKIQTISDPILHKLSNT